MKLDLIEKITDERIAEKHICNENAKYTQVSKTNCVHILINLINFINATS